MMVTYLGADFDYFVVVDRRKQGQRQRKQNGARINRQILKTVTLPPVNLTGV